MDRINHLVTEDFLRRVPLPMATESYTPVSNGDVIDTIERELRNKGMAIREKVFRSADGGEKSYGEFRISGGNSEMCMMLGFQNSYDKSLTVKLAAGASIFICSNGAVVGDIVTFRRKHTGDVVDELNYHIEVAVAGMEASFNELERVFARLKEIELSKRATAEIIGRMYIEQDVIKSTQLNIIKRELEKPTYPEFAAPTAFNLYQHTTHSLKSAHPSDVISTHIDVHKFFVETFQL